jgi:flagellar hook assembly protein FlgD
MKVYFVLLLLVISFIQLYAQTDSLLIKLKSGDVVRIPLHKIKMIQFANISDIDAETDFQTHLSIIGNYPNPFGEFTYIEFDIKETGIVYILIYDTFGNLIRRIAYDVSKTGKQTIKWDCLDNTGNRVPSGIYYYEVTFKSAIQTKKMIIIN